MIVGLTGHSGSGKTTVAGIFSQLGFYHVDCDRLVHTSVYADPLVHSALARGFGAGVVKDGSIDRRVLASIIFSDEQKYACLMQTLTPFIRAAVLDEIKKHSDGNVLVDAPALFEYGLETTCDITMSVISDNAISRIIDRDGISEEEAKKRLAHQKSHDFYIKNSDYVIKNNGSLDDLKTQTTKIYEQIMKGVAI